MNHGRFFSLDLETSCINDGISVFNYTDIFDELVVERDGQTTPRYPIFVSITSASVKFILHYCVYLIKDNGEFVPKLENSSSGEYTIRHMEEVLIELPLNTVSELPLSSILKRLYTTPFPIDLKTENNYISELIRKRYSNSLDSIGEQYRLKRDRDKNDINYSTLYVWDLYHKDKSGYILDNNKVLRKLILDFFFDMMHSDVFKNSMHYDTVYSKLMSDYFCSAIISKSEFYYQRALVNDILANNQSISKSITIYAENLDKAEAQWLKCIQLPDSDRHFEFKPHWFESRPNSMVINTVSQKLKDTFHCLLSMFKISHQFKIYNFWFASPEEELKRVYYVGQDIIISSSESLYSKISSYHKFNSIISFNINHIRQRRVASSRWMLKRYNFNNAYRLAWFPWSSLLLFSFICVFISKILWSDCIKPIWYAYAVIGIISIAYFYFITLKLDKQTICKGCYNSNCIKRSNILTRRNCIYIIFYPLIVLFNNIHLLYPRLIASIAAAWLTIAFSEDLYKAFFDSLWNKPTVISIIIFILLFVIYEINKIAPTISFIQKLFRATQLIVISLAISLFVGIFVINFTGDKMLVRSGILPEFYRDNVLVRSEIDDNGKPLLELRFDSIAKVPDRWNDSIIMNKYTHSPYKSKEVALTGEQSKIAVYTFANTKYGQEYIDRIRSAYDKDSLSKIDGSTIMMSDTIRGQLLLRHENSILFKDLLPYVEHTQSGRSIATFWGKFFVLRDFLIQFAVVAMFIGIFIQMIFEEKNVTES